MNGKAILVLLVMTAICQCVVIADTHTKAAPSNQIATSQTAPGTYKQNIAAHAASIVNKLGQVHGKLAAAAPPTGESITLNNVLLINHSSSKMCINMSKNSTLSGHFQNLRILERGKSIPITHKYMIAHFPGMAQTHQKKWRD